MYWRCRIGVGVVQHWIDQNLLFDGKGLWLEFVVVS